jgi:hypothetical protein
MPHSSSEDAELPASEVPAAERMTEPRVGLRTRGEMNVAIDDSLTAMPSFTDSHAQYGDLLRRDTSMVIAAGAPGGMLTGILAQRPAENSMGLGAGSYDLRRQ